jgi:hypothetical protein
VNSPKVLSTPNVEPSCLTAPSTTAAPPDSAPAIAVVDVWRSRYGAGSVRALIAAWLGADAELGGLPVGAHGDPSAAERAHVGRWGTRSLTSEKQDELARDRARSDDGELVLYQAHWDRRLRQLARRYPERFFTPGLSSEELRDALTLSLLEAIRRPEHDTAFTLPGKEWGLLVVTNQLRELRRRFRLEAELTDFQAVQLLQQSVSAEERWLEREARECEAWAAAAAERGLTQTERQWYAALRAAARRGDFFESSERLNLSAASRLLGRDRSSAHRAYREIRAHFQAELRSRQ